MTDAELLKNLRVTLSQVGSVTYRAANSQMAVALLIQSQFTGPSLSDGSMVLEDRRLVVLRALAGRCSASQRQIFENELVRTASGGNVSLAVHAAIEIFGTTVLPSVRAAASVTLNARKDFWQAVLHKVSYEAARFGSTDLDALEDLGTAERVALRALPDAPLPSACLSLVALLLTTLNQIRFQRLERELLEGVNPELNTDQQRLVERTRALAFRPAVGDAIIDLEKRTATAASPLDLKSCLDLARSILENVFEDATELAAKTRSEKLTLPTAGSRFKLLKDKLVSFGVLSENESMMVQGFYSHLSAAGGHRLASTHEDARIARAMLIELGLLLSVRLERSLAPEGVPSTTRGS